MDNDLNALLGQLMSQPDTMEKISAALSAMMPADAGAPPESPPPDAPSLPDLSMLQKLAPLLGGAGGDKNDPNVALLRALRPYLHDGREKRVDEAIDMLRLAKLLPLLKTNL